MQVRAVTIFDSDGMVDTFSVVKVPGHGGMVGKSICGGLWGCSIGLILLFLVFILKAELLDMANLATSIAGCLVHPALPLVMSLLASIVEVGCCFSVRGIGSRRIPTFGAWFSSPS